MAQTVTVGDTQLRAACDGNVCMVNLQGTRLRHDDFFSQPVTLDGERVSVHDITDPYQHETRRKGLYAQILVTPEGEKTRQRLPRPKAPATTAVPTGATASRTFRVK